MLPAVARRFDTKVHVTGRSFLDWDAVDAARAGAIDEK